MDDIDANLVALSALLESLDCDLVRAGSGNDALWQLLKREFAVVVLDVRMPQMDGFEVARYARENPATRNVPIIFVTANANSEEDVVRGYGVGAIDFLAKPINPEALRGKVQVCLDLYQSWRALADEVEAHKRTLADLETFNYFVAHDLRAGLRPLTGFTQVLLDDYEGALDDRGKDYLRRIHAAAQRMGQLIDDLLRLARISRSGIERKVVDLRAIAAAIRDEHAKLEPGRNVELTLPPELRVKGDLKLLTIVLDNLLGNAWKFTRRKAVGRIELGVKQMKGETVYFVRDNGAGFDPAFASRLFQPFQRLHASSEFDGTGIGLAIVARIIRQHGGRIWAEATPGLGATFYFTLPAQRSIALVAPAGGA